MPQPSPFSHSFSVPLSHIWVDRERRQRRKVVPESLTSSILRHGIMNPLIVRPVLPDSPQDARGYVYELIAGEQRLSAANLVGLDEVPVRLRENLSQAEAFELELEENIRRLDLSWQDRCRATAQLHGLWEIEAQTQNPPIAWSHEATAERLGFSRGLITMYLRVVPELEDPRIFSATTCRAAFDILSRRDHREVDDVLSGLLEVGLELAPEPEPGPSPGPTAPLPPASQPSLSGTSPVALSHPLPTTPAPAPPPRPESILLADFLTWAPQYSGPKFNLLHCDFPYGVNAFSGGSNRQHKEVGYDDSPDIYWALVAALCKNLDRFLAYSAHVVFWFSMNHYEETLTRLRHDAPSIQWDPFPLIWHKSDNAGIIPDASRGGRRTYETALFGAREDRKIIKPLALSYSAPTDKEHHPSTKPVPVLKHFFGMLVDSGTRLLDPTCGSGSALRAAEALGAAQVLGLELDPEHHANASRALRGDRALRGVGK